MLPKKLFTACCLSPLFCLPIESIGQTVADPPATVTPIEGADIAQEVDPQENTDSAEEPGKAQSTKSSGTEIDHFMRVRRDAKRNPIAFETSITRYVMNGDDGEPVQVDLMGVVHIGEQEYYEELNRLFEQYDAVLFELVAPEGTVIPKGGAREASGGLNPIAALQIGMQTVLGLEFQLEHIDYEKENFVHADMSPDEFLESMKNNDESFTKMFFKAMGHSMAQSGRSSMGNLDLLRVAFAKDKEMRMRQLFSKEILNMEGGMAIFEGREGSTIINHRNGKAMEVLEEEIAAGKKKLAIFYGAGHLPDMQRRLTSDFQMKRGGQFWLEAWKLDR